MWRVRGCSSTSPEGERTRGRRSRARSAGTKGRYTARPPRATERGNSEGGLRRGDMRVCIPCGAAGEHESLSVPAWSVRVCVCVSRRAAACTLLSGVERSTRESARVATRARAQVSLDWYSRKMCVACGVRKVAAEAADPVRARGMGVYFGCVKEKVLPTVAWWTRFTHVYAQYMYVSSMSHAFYMNSTASSTEQRAGAGFGCSTSTLSPPWRITL